MQEGQNKPTFGIFMLRVAVIALGIFLLGFIVWGVMKLADSSNFWGDLLRILGIVIVPLLIIFGIWMLIRFLSVSSVSINFARVLTIIIGLLLLGLIVWGITRLASSDEEGTVSVNDDSSSTVTLDEPESEPSADTDESTTDEDATPADLPATDETDDDESTATPNTGPRPETTPNTGIESILLPAISLGALAYAGKSYKQSRTQLKQI